MNPKISVIIGLYNCGATLPEALDSILAQTCTDWEMILCDDGSADDTYAVADTYRQKYPERIVLLQNPENLGLNCTLNRCLTAAKGEYIARMDGDDISLPERFAKEAAFLDAHPDVAIVSTPMIYFDQNGDWGRGTAIPRPQKTDFIKGTPFCHAPCMVRAEAYRAAGGYSTDKRTLRAEDYDLWFRLYALGFTGVNLETPYYKMRDDMSAYRRRKFRFALNEAYVRFHGFSRLHLPLWTYVYVLRPIAVSMLPKPLYLYLHHRKRG